ncbi:MAG: hypothetical protein HY746_07565 [Elusimicrobia bacterium]|nr:hypothetical protein [Elusimicrobiota bacterium]
MKILKYSGIILAILGLAFFILRGSVNIDTSAHFDAVIVDNELYFILEKEYAVGSVKVFKSSTTTPDPELMVWSAEVPAGGNWPKMRQIKYGQEITAFRDIAHAREELQKNTGYFALMGTSAKATFGTVGNFMIINDNKVVMPRHFNPKLPKKRTVIIKGNGKRITVPYSVSFDKDGHKVITAGPVPEK